MCVGLDEQRSLRKRRWGTPDESLARILDAAASIKKREDQLRRTANDLRTRVVKCVEVGGEDLRTFIVNCDKSVISV